MGLVLSRSTFLLTEKLITIFGWWHSSREPVAQVLQPQTCCRGEVPVCMVMKVRIAYEMEVVVPRIQY